MKLPSFLGHFKVPIAKYLLRFRSSVLLPSSGQEVCDLLDPEDGGTELRRNVGGYLPFDGM